MLHIELTHTAHRDAEVARDVAGANPTITERGRLSGGRKGIASIERDWRSGSADLDRESEKQVPEDQSSVNDCSM